MLKTIRLASNRLNRFIAAALTVAVAAAAMSFYTLTVEAVSYKGSGSARDPYLVETAAQLDGMRDNLKAHYKLANTIDLASHGNFIPIGNLSAKFTGTFTCDIGKDGYPLYAIKNLKVAVKSSAYTVKNKNKWEAALFGAIENATLSNIYVLNVDISNEVIGTNSGSAAWGNLKPGQDEQAAAALVGFSSNSNIKGCMSSGKIDAKCNNAGGLIGEVKGGSVDSCYSTVNVKTTGLWNTGGLIASCDADVSNCFATGNVSGGTTEPATGGLIGNTQGMQHLISNCYSTGTVSSAGNSLLGYDDKSDTTVYTMNCYTLGKIEGKSNPQTNTTVSNNNYILNTVNGFQPKFAAVSEADLLKAFSGLPDWNTTGVKYPQLKSVKILTDESRYVPGKVTEVPDGNNGGNNSNANHNGNNSNSGNNNNNTVSNTSDTTSQPDDNENVTSDTESSAPAASLEEVINLVNGLPDVKAIAKEHIAAIMKAKVAYDSLSESDLSNLPAETSEKMNAVYFAAMPVILADVAERIEALPETDKLSAENKEEIMAIKTEYDFLTDEAKDSIAAELKEKLDKAIEKIETTDEAETGLDAGSLSTAELMLIIVLSVLIAFTLAVNIFATVLLLKKRKKNTNL